MTEALIIVKDRQELCLEKGTSIEGATVVCAISPLKPYCEVTEATISSTPPSSFDSADSRHKSLSLSETDQAPRKDCRSNDLFTREDVRVEERNSTDPEFTVAGPTLRTKEIRDTSTITIPQRVVPCYSQVALLSGSCPTGGNLGGTRRAGASGSRSPVAGAQAGATPVAVQFVRPCPVKKAPIAAVNGSPKANNGKIGPQAVVATKITPAVTFTRDGNAAAVQDPIQEHQQQLGDSEAGRRKHPIQQQQQHSRQHLHKFQQQRQREATARDKENRQKEIAKRQREVQCTFPPPPSQQRRPQLQHAHRAATPKMGSRRTTDLQRPVQGQVSNGGDKHSQPVTAAQQGHHNGGAVPLDTHHHQTQGGVKQARAPRISTSSSTFTPMAGKVSDSDASALSSVPTLLFERLVSEEAQELKNFARIIEEQNRRLAELERVHDDLELRLERKSTDRMELEATLEQREKEWASRCEGLERERDSWKKTVETERTKNERLLDLVYRKDKEIHRMIQRKVRVEP